MEIIACPYCGYENLAHRMTCKSCHWLLYPDRQNSETAEPDDGSNNARHFLDDIVEILVYLPNYSGAIDMGIPAYLVDLKTALHDTIYTGIPEGLANLKLPKIDPGNIDLPTIDVSNVLQKLASLDLPDVDLSALGEILQGIDLSTPAETLQGIDLSGLGEILQGVDLSGLGEILQGVDLSVLGDILEGIDIN